MDHGVVKCLPGKCEETCLAVNSKVYPIKTLLYSCQHKNPQLNNRYIDCHAKHSGAQNSETHTYTLKPTLWIPIFRRIDGGGGGGGGGGGDSAVNFLGHTEIRKQQCEISQRK